MGDAVVGDAPVSGAVLKGEVAGTAAPKRFPAGGVWAEGVVAGSDWLSFVLLAGVLLQPLKVTKASNAVERMADLRVQNIEVFLVFVHACGFCGLGNHSIASHNPALSRLAVASRRKSRSQGIEQCAPARS